MRPGWTPGPSHGVASTIDGRFPGRPVVAIVRLAGGDPFRVEDGPTDQPLVGRLEERLGVGRDDMRRRRRSGVIAGLEVDLRPRQPGARHLVAEGRRLAQPRPDDQQRIGPVEPLADRRCRAEPGHPEVERMLVGHDVGTPPGGDDRHLEELGEAGQLGRRPGAQHARPSQDDRPAGRGEELDDRAHLVVARARRGRTGALELRVVRDGLVEEVLGEREQDGPGPAAECLANRLADRFAHGLGRRGFGRPLGQPAERGDLVDLLEGLAAADGALDLADDGEHRRRILARRVDPDGQVGPAHGTRPEADRRSAGELTVGFGHERGGALVAGRDHPDARALERVEQAEE